ncbi:MAM and LDL-receptor class A domain-containing 2-like, partial [Paramuricea clavata]
MDCIAWLQKKFITQHGDLISHEGLVWYENYGNAAMPSVDGESLWKRHEIDQITKADMQPLYQKETTTTVPYIPCSRQRRIPGGLPGKDEIGDGFFTDTSTDDERKILRRIEDNNNDGDSQREQSSPAAVNTNNDPPTECCSALINYPTRVSTGEEGSQVGIKPKLKDLEGEQDGDKCSNVHFQHSPHTVDAVLPLSIRIWSRTGTHGNQWRQGRITLSSTQLFTLVFEGVRGRSYQGDIALDDITLGDGKCPPARFCDFGDDWCHFSNIKGDQFDWTRRKGRTSSYGTGPSVDHTTGTWN